MPSSGDDAADKGGSDSGDAASGDSGRRTADADAQADAALSAAVRDADGDPECALCSKRADYFLYEPDSVRKFVCWEHVSPHSAAVDGEDARPGRPVALSL